MSKRNVPDLRVMNDLLEVKPELLGLHGMNSFITYNSSPRGLMMAGQLAQTLTIEQGDEKIILNGIETEMGKFTFSVKMENDSKVLAVIKRYRGISNDNKEPVAYMIVYEDLVKDEVSCIEVPYKHQLHPYFGFKYQRDYNYLNNLRYGDIIPGNTYLAKSPTVRDNDGSAIGKNFNIANVTLMEVGEDGYVISESAAASLSFKMYEKVMVECGPEQYFKNIYGDEDRFQAFPDVGEYIKPHGAFCVLAEHNTELSPAMVGKKAMMDFDPIFDNATYVRPGKCKVVDLKVYKSPKFKKDVYTGTTVHMDKYVKALDTYHRDVLDVYNAVNAENKNRYGTRDDLIVSEKFTSLIVHSKAIVDSNNPTSQRKVKKIYRKEALDIYRVEATIEIQANVGVGFKLTDINGGKGVVVAVLPDHLMPVDAYGNRADVIGDPSSIVSRMNIGRIYEQYISRSSRSTKAEVIKFVDAFPNNNKATLVDHIAAIPRKDKAIIFTYILEYLKIVSRRQYEAYSKANNNSIDAILAEIYTKELFIYIKVNHEKAAYQIVDDIQNSPYRVKKSKVMLPEFKADGSIEMIESEDDVLIGPLYMILLNKISDDLLCTASAKINHYGIPISVSKNNKHEYPWRNSPVKNLSETEGRLIPAYASPLALAEMVDRATSINTHKHIYNTILNAPVPTDIDSVVDRKKIPFGASKSLEITNVVLNSAGMELAYSPDANRVRD